MVNFNPRPHYFAVPYYLPPSLGNPRRIRGWFAIYETRGQETTLICRLSNRGDRLNNICKRGIPLDDARRIFYEMDEEPDVHRH